MDLAIQLTITESSPCQDPSPQKHEWVPNIGCFKKSFTIVFQMLLCG
jgi:hypothetical protein